MFSCSYDVLKFKVKNETRQIFFDFSVSDNNVEIVGTIIIISYVLK